MAGDMLNSALGGFKGPEDSAIKAGLTGTTDYTPSAAQGLAAVAPSDSMSDAPGIRIPSYSGPEMAPPRTGDAPGTPFNVPSGSVARDILAPPPTPGTAEPATPAQRSSSERVRDLNRPPAPNQQQVQVSDDTWRKIAGGVNLANTTAQMVGGLRGDLSQGPAASPLMARPMASGIPYAPTSRKQKPLTLQDLMARR